MFNKGDKVSVLDEAVDGVVLSVKDKTITIETVDGFVMNFEAKELIKIGESGNLLNEIKNFNVNEIKKERKFRNRVVLSKRKKTNTNYQYLNLTYTSKNWFLTNGACLITIF